MILSYGRPQVSKPCFHLSEQKVLVWLGFELKPQEDFRVSSVVSDLCWTYSENRFPKPSASKILKLRNLCKATLAEQKVSRVDLEGLIGLVKFCIRSSSSGG